MYTFILSILIKYHNLEILNQSYIFLFLFLIYSISYQNLSEKIFLTLLVYAHGYEINKIEEHLCLMSSIKGNI